MTWPHAEFVCARGIENVVRPWGPSCSSDLPVRLQPTPGTFLKSFLQQFSARFFASSEVPLVRLTLRIFCLAARLRDNSWAVPKYSLPFQYASTSQRFFDSCMEQKYPLPTAEPRDDGRDFL